MAKIRCVDCGYEFEDKNNTCPNCGCPVEVEKKVKNKSKNKDSKDVNYLIATAITSFLLMGGVTDYFTDLIVLVMLYVLIYCISKLILHKKNELPDIVQKYLTDKNLNIGLCISQLVYLVFGIVQIHNNTYLDVLYKIIFELSIISMQGIIVSLTLLIINPQFIKKNDIVEKIKDNLSLIYKISITVYVLANITFLLSFYSVVNMICFIPLAMYLYNRKELKKWH